MTPKVNFARIEEAVYVCRLYFEQVGDRSMTQNTASPVFALDIGTRTVVGLLLKEENNGYELLDMEVMEHAERSMLDGQIHNVPAVAQVIGKVKSTLEERHGPLSKVCVAAAGRSLRTQKAAFDMNIDGKPMLTRDDLLHLELSAVQKAQFALAQDKKDEASRNYYCVGYSVLHYKLDDEEIGSLLDQTGQTAAVEVIATFLPKVVVESLMAALSRTDLSLEALTLEPIAAINVLIPPSMRRLNVALVDIGAGTSDIAITEEGTVTAYGMVPVAGDEMTEALSDQFLLDFPDAERMKREITVHDEVTIQDILGMETTLAKEDVLSAIRPSVQTLAHAIANEILNLNGKAPKAVMLVGGGSLTPELPQHLARCLQLPDNRVAVRGIDAIKDLKQVSEEYKGPELVTPIGIAIAAKENPIEYISITVNGRTLRLFDVKTLTVGDGLIAAGIDIAKLYGKPGLAVMMTLQGRLITIPGEHGEPPMLMKNGEATSLDEPLKAEDRIEVIPGQDGKKASPKISDLLDEVPTLSIEINGEAKQITGVITKNGKPTSLEAAVEERDVIDVTLPQTIAEAFDQLGISFSEPKPFTVFVDGQKIEWTDDEGRLLKNGIPVTGEAPLKAFDKIDYIHKVTKPYTINSLWEKLNLQPTMTITVTVNGQPVTLEKTTMAFWENDRCLDPNEPLRSHQSIILKKKDIQPFTFQDLFSVIDIDLSPSRYRSVRLLRNDHEIQLQTRIRDGDQLYIQLEERAKS